MLSPFQNRAKRALAENPFFGSLADECLRWVRRTSVRRGEQLFEKGDPSNALFGLVRGQAKLCSTRIGAPPVAFRIVAPGELVGEIGIANGGPRHANAIALAHSEFATLGSRDLEALFERQPELHGVLSAAAAEDAQRLAERIEDAAFLTTEQRVEKALRDCARRFGQRIEGRGLCVELRQQDLADVVGLSRATVNKVLTSPSMLGHVEIGRGRITLLSA